MRSMPGAMPPCGGAPYWKARYMPPNFFSSIILAIAREREGLLHDVGTMVADRAGRQFDAVANDVILKGLDRRGSSLDRPDRAPETPRDRNLASRKGCARSRFSSRPRSIRTSENRRSSRIRRRPFSIARAHGRSRSRAAPASFAPFRLLSQAKKTASPALRPALSAILPLHFGGKKLGDRPFAGELARLRLRR